MGTRKADQAVPLGPGFSYGTSNFLGNNSLDGGTAGIYILIK